MLARVAETLYWQARYLERVENTAKLILSSMNLIMDLPTKVPVSWNSLLEVLGQEASFYQYNEIASEQAVCQFIIVDSPFSLAQAVAFARENARTTRDLYPRRIWQLLNSMYLFANERKAQTSNRRRRVAYLEELVNYCEQLSGALASLMSRNESFRIWRLGKLIERADMTTRLIDVRASGLLGEEETHYRQYGGIIWLSLLNAIDASQMYRANYHHALENTTVLRFLLDDNSFPRSYRYCIESICEALEMLPAPQLDVDKQALLGTLPACLNATSAEQLHPLMDEMQQALQKLHVQLEQRYFGSVSNETTETGRSETGQ